MTLHANIAIANFWPGFSLASGFVGYFLGRIFDSYAVVPSEEEADIVFASVYPPNQPRPYPERTIAYIGENVRPDYRNCRYSISSDFDSYGDRNCRLPGWYRHLSWPGYVKRPPVVRANTTGGFEPTVDVDALYRPRPLPSAANKDLFCCFVASHLEHHRMLAVERLAGVGRVDVFGLVAGNPYQASKFELLPRYRFNLCFENSIFPGYYTEKLLQAWVGGCIPLYYSDSWFALDFNPRALINRIDFSTIDEFVRHVAAVNASHAAMTELYDQPLLVGKRPTLDHAIDFTKKACARILNDSARARLGTRGQGFGAPDTQP
jgi:alpha(1,3/1,4) fucosyltransferase